MGFPSRDRQGQNKWRWSIQMSSQDRRTESLNLWLKCPSSQPDGHKAPPRQRDRPARLWTVCIVHLPSFKGVHSDWLIVIHSEYPGASVAAAERRIKQRGKKYLTRVGCGPWLGRSAIPYSRARPERARLNTNTTSVIHLPMPVVLPLSVYLLDGWRHRATVFTNLDSKISNLNYG